jgi:hypothetical protein
MLNLVTWNHVFHDKLLFLFTLNSLIIYIYLFSPGHLFISNLCHGFVGLKTFHSHDSVLKICQNVGHAIFFAGHVVEKKFKKIHTRTGSMSRPKSRKNIYIHV